MNPYSPKTKYSKLLTGKTVGEHTFTEIGEHTFEDTPEGAKKPFKELTFEDRLKTQPIYTGKNAYTEKSAYSPKTNPYQ
jgi:hypothetical protein